MAWLPISGTLPQYSTSANELANDYYLKFYAAGTSTPINMATDSTGGTLLAKCALSADGYPISNPLDDSTVFIPHIDQNYRVVLYTNETDADNNATGSAAFNIDGMQLQAIVTGDAADVTLRAETLEEFDDYDRSPLFTDGDGFTAGAGPHVITVPAGWTPTNADMRFYKLDNSGIVTPLTPTAKTATTFTLTETLLSTDTVFLGDDVFRASRVETSEGPALFKANNLSDVASASAAFNNIKQKATETSTGVVEEATAAEMTAGTDGKFPDCATVNGYYGEYIETTVDMTGVGPFTGGTLHLHKIGKEVTVYSSGLTHSSASNPIASAVIPSDYLPDSGAFGSLSTVSNVYWITSITSEAAYVVAGSGNLGFYYRDWAGAAFAKVDTGAFTLKYIATNKA